MREKAIELAMVAAVAWLLLGTNSSMAATRTHCDATFVTNIAPRISVQPNGTFQTVSGDCTSAAGCHDYFDITLRAGDTLNLTFCSNGGAANFDTGLAVWSGPPFTTLQDCNDDVCGLLSEMNFVAPAAGTYRVKVGGFGTAAGRYTLAYRAPSGSTIIGVGSPPLVCDVQMSQASYSNGQMVTAQVARLQNPGTNPVPVEVKLWFDVPGSPPAPFLTVGADGSFVLSPGFNTNFGPLPLVTVVSAFPRGSYGFNCRLLHAVTGASLAEDLNPFQIQ